VVAPEPVSEEPTGIMEAMEVMAVKVVMAKKVIVLAPPRLRLATEV
jgi:hypothetical protein